MTTMTSTVLTARTSADRWETDLHTARTAGLAAVAALDVVPMTVVGNGRSYHVEGGVCGFARVEVRPRTSAWAKWLRLIGWRSSDYFKCVTLNISEFGQSMQRKEAYAAAFADHLTRLGYPGVSWTSVID
jgi:hypothetical protein